MASSFFSIFYGVDKYREFKENEKRRKEQAEKAREDESAEYRAKILAEGRAVGLVEGIAQGRAEALADIQIFLLERGIDPEDILPPEENGSQPSA